MNHPDELIAQLRILGRLEEFGSGARFKRRFQGAGAEERIHWHLRRTCFVRRLKKDVLPQLPEKRQVVVPVALENEKEYRLAERDVIAWLQEQPLELSELEAQGRRRRCAPSGSPSSTRCAGSPRAASSAPALAWIDDFLRVRGAARRLRLAPRDPGDGRPALPGGAARRRRRQGERARRRRPGLPGARRPAADRLLDARRRPGHHAHARLQRRLPRPRVEPGDARPGRGPPATASASATRSPPGTCSPPSRSTSRWPRCSPASAGSSARSPTAAGDESEAVVQSVVKALRGKPLRRLRAVGLATSRRTSSVRAMRGTRR